MKTRLLVAACVLTNVFGLWPLVSRAQETPLEILFSNKVTELLDAPVYDVDGLTPLAGVNFQVELCFDASPIGGLPVAVAGAASAFALNGYFNDGTRIIEGFAAGAQVSVWVRAWDLRTGSSFPSALVRAESNHLLLTVPGSVPPPIPSVLIGLESFALRRNSPPTAATLAEFRATATGTGEVRLAWRTLVEAWTLGFRVERRTPESDWQRVTTTLIPASGSDFQPHTYGLLDAAAPTVHTLEYRLVEVDLRGQEKVLATAAVKPALTAKVAFGPPGLTVDFRGQPAALVALETAVELTGPWTRLNDVELDRDGTASVTLGISTNETARFYRWEHDEP